MTPRGSRIAVRSEGEKVVEIRVLDAVEDSEAADFDDWCILNVDEDEDADDHDLDRTGATRYRGIAARLNYVASDRIDIQQAVKEAARCMSTPRASSMTLLNRIGRYLLG